MEKSAVKNVAGRKPIVMMAIVFIDKLSFFALSAIKMLVIASSRVNRAKA